MFLLIYIDKIMKILLCVFFSLISFSSHNHLSNENTGVIRGRIIDSEGAPIVMASVQIKSLNRGSATDDRGMYRLINIPQGTYSITYTFHRYSKTVNNVRIRANRVKVLNVTLY
jgi:iron complex outermembrane receptor protein